MSVQLDHDSPVPLYHQISEVIAYRIATGRLRPGEALPAVRDAAVQLRVNLHTVRRAYAELARSGLVIIAGARGTRVADGAAGRSGRQATASERFVQRVLREASERHGLAPQDLSRLIANWSAPPAAGATASVVECSLSQCRDHADEIEARWRVAAAPWPLSNQGAPPPGPIVATFFHHQEIRERWPRRRGDLQLVAIQPDARLRRALTARAERRAARVARLCEFDEPKALNIAADVSSLLAGSGWRVEPIVCKRSAEALRAARRGPVLFSPRAWAGLDAAGQRNPRAIKVRYVMVPEELEALGPRFGWRARE